MRLTLKLPRQQRRAWFSRPRAMEQRQWLERLPMDRPGAVLRLINRRLRALNFTAMPAGHRARCLAPYHGVLGRLHEAFTVRLAGRHMPLDRRLESDMGLLAESWARLAVGYQCAIRDQRRTDSRQIQDAALGVLRALARLLLARAQVYGPVPPGSWRHIHECHALAGKRKPQARPPEVSGDATDLDTAYKQCLLLGATGLHRLRPTEQAALFRVLPGWVRDVPVRRLRRGEPKGPPVVFRPGEDETPRIYPLDQIPDAPGLWLMDPAPLAGRARQRLNRIEGGDEGAAEPGRRLAPDTLRALLAAWSGTPARRFPRIEDGQESRVTPGLKAAWQALSARAVDGGQACRVLDRSATGFLAEIEAPPPGIVHVGEVLAVHDENAWSLGVVRWLRWDGERALCLGVETLSRDPRPSSVAHAGAPDAIPVFLLEGNRAMDQPPTLVAPSWPLREQMTVKLVDGAELTLHRCLESTGAFRRYRYGEPGTA